MSIEPRPLMTDENGDKWWNFEFSYRFDGDEYAFSVPARNVGEAKARLSQMGMARYEGQCDGRPIPAHRGAFVPMFVWWRNLWA